MVHCIVSIKVIILPLDKLYEEIVSWQSKGATKNFSRQERFLGIRSEVHFDKNFIYNTWEKDTAGNIFLLDTLKPVFFPKSRHFFSIFKRRYGRSPPPPEPLPLLPPLSTSSAPAIHIEMCFHLLQKSIKLKYSITLRLIRKCSSWRKSHIT